MDNHATNIPRMTAEEYFKTTPETNQPTELIEGEIVAQASPSRLHQRISGRMFAVIDGFIRANGGNCEVDQTIDVQLSDENVVVPDLCVICDPEKLDSHGCKGAPDFVVEITSTNRRSDYGDKLVLYRAAGVREYWIVDTRTEKVLVYQFENNPNTIAFYNWTDSIPVGIYAGKLEIRISDFL